MILGATIRLKDQFTPTFSNAQKQSNKFTSKLKIIGSMVVRPVIAITDRATKALGKIKDSLLSIKGLAATALAGLGAGKVVGAGMMLEQQQVSMEHFIGIQNKGLTPADIKKQADEYIGWMRKYADITPFGTNEVIGGGTRAINIAGGNIAQAKELVKLAGNMAALNPEKTFSDAMEALADLRVGETERMKEFGFKISQEDIKKAGGVDAVISKQIQPFFEGGAKKLSETGAGLWSTITGGMGTAITTMGSGMLEGLKPQLQGLVSWMGDNNENISLWATNLGQGLGNAIKTVSEIANKYMPPTKAALSSVLEWLGPKIDWVKSKIPFLKTVWETAWPAITTTLKTAWKIASPILSTIGSLIKIVWGIFEVAWPSIVKIVETAWSIMRPIFDAIAGGLGLIAKGVKWVAEKFDVGPKEVTVVSTGMGDLKAKGHASGLPRVPYDNYPALLHRGERVLTAAESRQYIGGGPAVSIVIPKLADTINASDPADVDRMIDRLVERIRETRFNMPKGRR